MQVENHRLVDTDTYSVDHKTTPNIGKSLHMPMYIVHHYTAGHHETDNSVGWMMNKDAGVSAHVFVPREGPLITQLAPFDQTTWHAGKSKYNGLKWLNRWSLGIEISNPGVLEPIGNGKYKTSYGAILSRDQYDIIDAPMPHRKETQPKGWLAYTDFQKKAVREITRHLRDAYKDAVHDVVGHSDISRGRKLDPGPAWNLAAIREDIFPEYSIQKNARTTANLNMRMGMSTDHRVRVTLPENAIVSVIGHFSSGWCRVRYTYPNNTTSYGFVSETYLDMA